MSVVVRNDRDAQLRAALVASGINLSLKAARQLLQRAATGGGSTASPTPTIRVQPLQRPKRKSAKPSRPSIPSSRIPRGLSNGLGNTCPVHLRGIYSVVNTSAGLANLAFTLGCTVSSSQTIGSFSQYVMGNNVAAYASMYREWKLLRLTCKYLPAVNNTAAGQVAMGIDPEVMAGTPGGFGAVVRHRCNLFDALWNDASFTWSPSTSRDREEKFTSSTTHSEGELSFGVLQIYSSNSLASGAAVGSLLMDVDVLFTNPN